MKSWHSIYPDQLHSPNQAPNNSPNQAPVKESISKAPKLKISSNSILKDERVNNAFKFEDAELKGNSNKTDRKFYNSFFFNLRVSC